MIALMVLFYIMTFNPNAPARPLGIDGPYSHADCLRIERGTSGTWCQPIRVRKR
jgi:hypothetical protein